MNIGDIKRERGRSIWGINNKVKDQRWMEDRATYSKTICDKLLPKECDRNS